MRTFRNTLLTLRAGFSIRTSALRYFSSTPVRCIDYKSLPELRQLVEEKRSIAVTGTTYQDTDDVIRFKFGKYGEIEDIVRPSVLGPTRKDTFSPAFTFSMPGGPRLRLHTYYDTYLYVVFCRPETAAEVLQVASKTPFQYVNHLYTVALLTKYDAKHLNKLAEGQEGKELLSFDDMFRLVGFPKRHAPEDVFRELSPFGSLLYVKMYNWRKHIKPVDVKFADLRSSRDLQRQTETAGVLRLADHLVGIRPSTTLVTPSSSILMMAWALCDKAYFMSNIFRLDKEIRRYLTELSNQNELPAPKLDKSIKYLLPKNNHHFRQCFPCLKLTMAYDSVDLAKRARHIFASHSRSREGWVLDPGYPKEELDDWWITDKFGDIQSDRAPRHAKIEQTSLKVPSRKNWGSPGPD